MEGWPALREDLVVLDYEGFIGGRPFKGGKGENVSLILGSHQLLPGFEEQLAGLQKGQTKEFSLDLPPDHPRTELAGRRALFKVVVKEVKKKRVPPLDDEFAKAVGECEGLKELKEKVRGELLQQKEREQEERLREKILEKVAEAHPVGLPESLVEEETERLLSELLGSLPAGSEVRGLHREGEDGGLRAKLQEVARRRVKASLLLEAIAQKEGLQVTEEELDREVGALASSLHQDPAALRSLLSQRGRLEGLRAQMLQRKALDLLYQTARIVEPLNLVTLA
jgi:trigger factor